MFLQPFPEGPLLTNAYVVACDSTRAAAIIDPAQGSAPLIQKFLTENALKCQLILLTHSHWDHIADVTSLKNTYPDATILIHSLDIPNLEQPGADGLPCPLAIPPIQADGLLEESTPIQIGKLTFQVIHTPGHSPGCVCFYEPTYSILISGDTLFKGSIGNVSFPTSRPDLISHSLTKLAALPPQTKVFPGHGPTTTIASEHRTFERMKGEG